MEEALCNPKTKQVTISDWTYGTAAKLREPIHESLKIKPSAARMNRRTPIQRPAEKSETTAKFGKLAELKLELTMLHIENLKEEAKRNHTEGGLRQKILETDLAIKETILKQEKIKLDQLNYT